jgi:hypothetical protein
MWGIAWDKWSMLSRHGISSRLLWTEWLPVWSVAVNILNKQSWTPTWGGPPGWANCWRILPVITVFVMKHEHLLQASKGTLIWPKEQKGTWGFVREILGAWINEVHLLQQQGLTKLQIRFYVCVCVRVVRMFWICHYDMSGKPGWLEIKWYISASGLCWWC